MTDEQVIAKVRAAAEAVARKHGRCGGCEVDVPLVDGRHDWRGGGLVACTDVTPPSEVISARAALAMVEQWEWHNERDTRSRGMEHRDTADRIMAALRKAVGEVTP